MPGTPNARWMYEAWLPPMVSHTRRDGIVGDLHRSLRVSTHHMRGWYQPALPDGDHVYWIERSLQMRAGGEVEPSRLLTPIELLTVRRALEQLCEPGALVLSPRAFDYNDGRLRDNLNLFLHRRHLAAAHCPWLTPERRDAIARVTQAHPLQPWEALQAEGRPVPPELMPF